MSYKVLYRKYRPTAFNKVVGQQTIIDNLKKSVEENSFSHAYIFTGPRGTGKTSTAKVLAKALTCLNPKEGEACGECENCKNFDTSPDVIEIDAASNNGVDEIRELRTNITLAPAASKYKIYIIDEVHMLSAGAFNALLKTLEEPPSHAVFILATTEVYKVPITILSRCQRYDFKKIDKKSMLDHLKDICHEENINYENGVLEEIYDLSEGCLRDALSILDQTSKQDKNLKLDSLLKSYNMISDSSIRELLQYLVKENIDELIAKIDNYEDSGMNAQKLLKKIINYLSRLAVDIKTGKNKEFSFQQISKLIESLNRCYIDARINENVFNIIKLCFLEAIENPVLSTTKEDSQKKPEIVKDQKPGANTHQTKPKLDPTVPQEQEQQNQKNMSIEEIRINNCFVEASKDALNDLIDKWTKENINITSIDQNNYKPVAASKEYAIFTTEEDSLANLFNIKREDIESNLKKENILIKVVAITTDQWLNERNKYKKNIQNNIKYEYVEEPVIEEDTSKLKKEVEDLFAEDLVEIS